MYKLCKDKISQEKVYQFLLFFDIIYPKFTDAEKKEFLGSIIERIEINPEPTEKVTVECVVHLCRAKP